MTIFDAEVRDGIWTAVAVMGSDTAQGVRMLDAISSLYVAPGTDPVNDWQHLTGQLLPGIEQRVRSWESFDPYQSGWHSLSADSKTHVMFQLSRSSEYFGVTLGRAQVGAAIDIAEVWQNLKGSIPQSANPEKRVIYRFVIYALEYEGAFDPDRVQNGIRFERTAFGFVGSKKEGNNVTWWVAFERGNPDLAAGVERDYWLNQHIPLASHHWLRTVQLLEQSATLVTEVADSTGKQLSIVSTKTTNLQQMDQVAIDSETYLKLFDKQTKAAISHRQAMANLRQLESLPTRTVMGAAWPNLVQDALQIESHLLLLEPVLSYRKERLEVSERMATARIWPLLISLSVLAGISACVDLASLLVPGDPLSARTGLGLGLIAALVVAGSWFIRGKK
ncbi:hypothetical protein MCEMSE15_00723 [Fimbriimonadaceae bacterium]